MVQFGFAMLSLIMVGSLWLMINRFSQAGDQQKRIASKRLIIWFPLWLIYLFIVSSTELLKDLSLPPKMPLLVVLPALGTAILFMSRKSTQSVLLSVNPSIPVYFQSFRVFVELLIYGAFLDKVLPQSVTFEGSNHDIFVGVSALAMGFLLHKGLVKKWVMLAWNFASLGILGYTVYTFIYSFYFSGIAPPQFFEQFVQLPYLLLPALLMPYAVFLHVVSIRQTIQSTS